MKPIQSIAIWTAILAAFWLMLTSASWSSWLIGLPFILLAILLQPQKNDTASVGNGLFSITGLLQLIYFFISESLRGGIDVSRRVMTSKPEVDPGFYQLRIRLQKPHAQKLFISSISLMPGTLFADQHTDQLRIHTLDQRIDTVDSIQKLEALIAKTFRETL